MFRLASKRLLSTTALLRGSSSSAPAAASGAKPVLSDAIPGFREPGTIATDYEVAAGLERYELLKKLRGEDPWEDLHPIHITKLGTVKEPIVVRGIDDERYIGCTGFPADSHPTTYLTVRPHKGNHVDRCHVCGNVFKYIQEEEHHDHH
ncbi:Cytochrome c oxidase subunit 4 [Kappamyces sp. JEL0829]|nr:Cytochrome c oxidase subunit 4 [Kappamyces sp. JEL0829]